MSGNPIGESGTTALAAALKISHRIQLPANQNTNNPNSNDTKSSFYYVLPVLHTLDISSCDVGDIGAEALAMAIANNPGCVKCLNLSNNKISNKGAIALAKAVKVSYMNTKNQNHKQKQQEKEENKNECNYDDAIMDCLDLSNNSDINDEGAIALLDAVECGAIRCLLLQSCSIRAKGAALLGEVIGRMTFKHSKYGPTRSHDDDNKCSDIIRIDISGNKLGTNVGKKKKEGYSKAMMNSMNSIGQKGLGFLKSGLKDIVDFGGGESDDEAEEEDSSIVKPDELQVSDKCGAILFYDAFMDCCDDKNEDDDHREEVNEEYKKDGYTCSNTSKIGHKKTIQLVMRMCNFDNAALDAFAAMKYHVKHEYGNEIEIDCDLNYGTDMESVQALNEIMKGDDNDEDVEYDDTILVEMKTRHLDALNKRQRAIDAKNAEARMNGLFLDDDSDDDDNDGEDFGYNGFMENEQYDPYDDDYIDEYD